MKYKEFDAIIDIIEKDIKSDWTEIESKLKLKLGMTSCDIGAIFKFFWIDDLTLNHYFKKRKMYRTLQAWSESPGESIEKIANEFGYKDYSTFFRAVQNILNTNPNAIIEKGDFKAPEIKHVRDIISEDSELIPQNRIASKEKGYEEYWEKHVLIDSITEMRNKISYIKSAMRETNDKKTIERMEAEIFRINQEIKETEERLEVISRDQVVINNLTPGLYSEFLTMEGCRSIYGISISRIIELYNESVSKGVPLDIICDYYSEREFLGLDDYSEDYDNDDWEEEYERFMIEEMSLEESWQYYNDDDAVDPYAPIEEDVDC